MLYNLNTKFTELAMIFNASLAGLFGVFSDLYAAVIIPTLGMVVIGYIRIKQHQLDIAFKKQKQELELRIIKENHELDVAERQKRLEHDLNNN